MRISNETKVGALTVISVTLLVLGYNFLKGKSLTRKTDVIYARFSDVGALEISNAVKIKGFRVGNVYDISSSDQSVSEVIVTISLQEKVQIPVNSVATIVNSLTGASSIFIIPGDATEYISLGDTLKTTQNPDILSKVMSGIDPLLISVEHAVDTLRKLLSGINNMLDAPTQAHFRSIVKELDQSSQNLAILLNPESGALAKTLHNADSFTQNLNKNNRNINETIENLKTTSQQIAQTQIKETVQQVNVTLQDFQSIVQKAKGRDGTIGLLLNDPQLYNSLQRTSKSLNTLLDDLKTHPKRYVSFSVFGKKDKTQPLKAPLSDTIH
jgi:phospholipid/cholesterol/gamma-HCH transport system substrate-binding protein